MRLPMFREAKIYADPKTGELVYKLGYAMTLFLHLLDNLKPGEPIPDGIISPTGDGLIPGIRKHLAGDAILLGFAERMPSNDPKFVLIKISATGSKAARNHEVIGRKPPRLGFYRNRIVTLIEQDRKTRQQERRAA